MGLFIENCGCMTLLTGALTAAYSSVVIGVILHIGWIRLWIYTVKNMSNKEAIPTVCGIYAVLIFIYLLFLIFSILLIKGVNKKKKKILMMFLVYTGILIGIHTLGDVYTFVMISDDQVTLVVIIMTTYCTIMVVLLSISEYTIICYYKSITRAAASPASPELVALRQGAKEYA